MRVTADGLCCDVVMWFFAFLSVWLHILGFGVSVMDLGNLFLASQWLHTAQGRYSRLIAEQKVSRRQELGDVGEDGQVMIIPFL